MSIVREFIEQGYDDRIQQFQPEECPLDAAEEMRQRWAQAGSTVVFMAGVFDIPTPNHRFGLAEARLMGGAMRLGIDYAEFSAQEPLGINQKDRELVMAEAASDNVRLLVTVDTDDNVRRNKAFMPEKGGSPKPIFCWGTRAYNLASYTVPRPSGSGHNMVDFVTRHGLNSCSSCLSCMSRDNALMVPVLQPNLVVVNAASKNTLDAILLQRETRQIPQTIIGITNEDDHQFVDNLIGGRVSSSSIIRRAKAQTDDAILTESMNTQYVS